MTPNQLSNEILLLESENIVEYIGQHRATIRFLFLNEGITAENQNDFGELLTTLCTKDFSDDEMSSTEVQSLFVHLAYFFKRADVPELVDSCRARITNPYFKYRLSAWRKYTKYHSFAEHLEQFEAYLAILIDAQDESEDGNDNELLQDIQEYYDYEKSNLNEEYFEKLEALFNDEDLLKKYPLLRNFADKNASEVADLNILPYAGTEYEPSDFALKLFDGKFLAHIRNRSIPGFPQKLLGFDRTEMYNAIGGGQANYDEKYKSLTSDDIVNLYCYFNMRMHFFSSYSFFSRSELAEKYYDNTGGKIKFIDLGCGPATSGIAFIDYLFEKTREKVVFDYYGIDISETMLEKAADMLKNDAYPTTNRVHFFTNLSDVPTAEFVDANCIIINCCYVFASTSLPIEQIANYINTLTEQYPFIPKYLMYQNSTIERLNEGYKNFKKLLKAHIVERTGAASIKYHNEQNPYWAAKEQRVFYELLKLS